MTDGDGERIRDGAGREPGALPIAVTVVRGPQGEIEIQAMRLPAGATVAMALARAGLHGRLERMLSTTRTSQSGVHGVSIHGERTWPGHCLSDGDRIEVTDPVSLDVRLRRRARVDQNRQSERDRRDQARAARRARAQALPQDDGQSS